MNQPSTCQACEVTIPGRKRPSHLCQSCKTRKYTRDSYGPDYQAVYHANRRARELGSAGNITLAEWLELKQLYSHSCAYCGYASSKLHLEHVIPLCEARDGNPSATNTVFNIVPACGMCNRAKGSLPLIVFLAWRNGMLAA